jgi:hypothetical protein
MLTHVIPSAFVWTKIEADAGQGINHIIQRKELERQSGGSFWWGIGESKIDKIKSLLARDMRPAVIFSKMRSRAHARDSNPDGVLLWEAYEAARGAVPLPPHVIITSRAHDSRGRLKSRHYALVCETLVGLPCSGGGALDTGSFRNFGDGGKRMGSSQITAVVERTTSTSHSLAYPITARATLVAPYAVQLSAPRVLSANELRLLNDVSVDGKATADWIAVANQLRRG